MDREYDISGLWYHQEKGEFMKSIFAWVLFFIAIIMLFISKINLYDMILQCIRLVIIIILLMFMTHSDDINPKPIQRIIKINLIIMIGIFTYRLVPLESVDLINNSFYVEKYHLSDGNIYFFLLYYIISKYKKENREKVVMEYTIILAVIVSIEVVNTLILKNNITIIIVSYIIAEIILIVAMVNVYKQKLVINGKVNLLKVNIIVALIYVNAIEIIKVYKLTDISAILGGISLAIFISSLVVVIDNISKNMYGFIFKDIYNINEKLDKLNLKVLVRNDELEKYQIKIKETQKSYKELIATLPKAIIVVNRENNRVIYCNNCFQELVGINNARKILNRKLKSIISLNIDYKKLSKDNIAEVYFGKTKGSKEKNIELRLSNYNEDKEEIIMVLEDVTEKMKIDKIKNELERKKINDNIKKNFLANVSHDFKIPINVICSATQLETLLINNNDIEGVKKYNSISKQNCLTLIKLTNNIIDMSKINSEYMVPALTRSDIVSFIEESVISLVEYARLSKISIIFDTDEEELYMKYDKELMERIILNLVSNAIKFTPEYGEITVEIRNDENSIFIIVRDTGIGMDKVFCKEAFEKYSKNLELVGENVQGTGVGLYVVYNLVRLQKGEIWVDSEVGQGTEFTMRFYKE